jgi:hypothetical protein
MSCCPASGSYSSKDAAFASLVANKASICQLCATTGTFGDVNVTGNLIVNNQPLIPTNLFTLPLAIPFVTGTLGGTAQFNLGGSPPVFFPAVGDSITLNNVYVPAVANLTYRLPCRDFGGSGTCVIDVSINGVVTSALLAGGGVVTFVDVPLTNAVNPITIIITFASGIAPMGVFDGVICVL